MDLQLGGRTALVTGSSSGIGLAIATALARVAYLASPLASATTGAVVRAEGGILHAVV